MKTSNKILLSVLLAFLLVLTSLHLVLYAKYKSGDFVSENEMYSNTERHPLPAIKYVSITGLDNCYLISNAAQPVLEINKENRGRLSYKVVGDTLVLTGDSTIMQEAYEHDTRNHTLVNLKLPATAQVMLAYGSLWLAGGFDSAHAPSYAIELAKEAHLGIMTHFPENTNVFFNRVDLVTNKSSVDMDDRTIINELNVHAVASYLNYRQASIGKMTLDADPRTTVTLSGKSLKGLHEISKP